MTLEVKRHNGRRIIGKTNMDMLITAIANK